MKINKDTVFTTYGFEYNPERFMEIQNKPHWNKPFGGMWASCNESPCSWGQWVHDNDFYPDSLETRFDFKISPEAKILKIESVDEVHLLPTQTIALPNMSRLNKPIDFEVLSGKYDAIWVALSEDWGLYNELYGWDVDTLLVINQDIIEVL